MSSNTNNLRDTRFNSLPEILDWYFWSLDKTKEENRQHIDEAIAAVLALLPEKRPLIEPVTKRPVDHVGAKVGIDLDADIKGSLKFIQDNGFDMAIDQTRRNLIGEQLGDSNSPLGESKPLGNQVMPEAPASGKEER